MWTVHRLSRVHKRPSSQRRSYTRTVQAEILDRAFAPVAEEFKQQISNDWFVGGGVCVYHNNKPVLNLRGGNLRIDPTKSFGMDTLLLIASCTKFAESACIAVCHAKGNLKIGEKISKYWPEFSTGDKRKENITVSDLMKHKAGLPYLENKLTYNDLKNQATLSKILEQQKVVFSPEEGIPPAYHAITRGLIASQIIQRVDPKKRTLGQFFREEIAAPIGISDEFYIGLPESEDHRVDHVKGHDHSGPIIGKILKLKPFNAEGSGKVTDYSYDFLKEAGVNISSSTWPLYDFTHYEIDFLRDFIGNPNSVASRSLNLLDMSATVKNIAEVGNHRSIREVELPSSNGCATAHGMAALSNEFLQWCISEENSRIFKNSTKQLVPMLTDSPSFINLERDRLLNCQAPFTPVGFGIFLNSGFFSYGWGGAGGSLIRFVPSLNLAFAFVSNTAGIRMAMHDTRPANLFRKSIEVASRIK